MMRIFYVLAAVCLLLAATTAAADTSAGSLAAVRTLTVAQPQ